MADKKNPVDNGLTSLIDEFTSSIKELVNAGEETVIHLAVGGGRAISAVVDATGITKVAVETATNVHRAVKNLQKKKTRRKMNVVLRCSDFAGADRSTYQRLLEEEDMNDGTVTQVEIQRRFEMMIPLLMDCRSNCQFCGY